MSETGVAAMLFDLDGTLLDTAPDMVGALNDVRAGEGLAPLPVSELRSAVNQGALGLIAAGMPHATDAQMSAWKDAFLAAYAENLSRHTAPFPGIDDVIDTLDRRRIPWGVVTNKLHRYTMPVLEGVGLAARCATIVSGDTTARSKPHPDPVQHALARVGVSAAAALYIGDAERDIASGRAAGTQTCAVRWGYFAPADAPESWGADHVIAAPEELLSLL